MSKIRIALIESHELTRVGIRVALQQQQRLEVVGEAANANHGLQMLKTTAPDVVILEICLPGKNGIELTKQLKAVQETGERKTKVLILTRQDSKETVLEALAAGADSYCLKDISFNHLLEALHVTHGGNVWIDPAIARIVVEQAKLALDPPPVPKAEQTPKTLVAYPLTERELEVLHLMVEGCSNSVIAEKLYIAVGTVKTHVRSIMNKLCADDRTQAAIRAVRSGLIGIS